jgi:hypothetical protein
MQKSFRILGALAVLALGIWGWRVLFPSPEKIIRSRLDSLAASVSFEPGEGTLTKGYKAQKLTEFFTPDVEIDVNMREYPPQTFSGRDELVQSAMWIQTRFRSVKVELIDINIKLADDKQSAVANLTCKIFLSGERDFTPQELNFTLKKVDNKWLIYRIETVRTLALAKPAFLPALLAGHDR